MNIIEQTVECERSSSEMSAPKVITFGAFCLPRQHKTNMFRIDFTVKKAKWLENPNLRWRAGLENAGLQFRQRLQRQNYPPPPPMSTYIRTGTLANKAGFSIYEAGDQLTMFFGSTFYLPYLLYGTPQWVGWTPYGKKEELLQYMSAGFKEAVKNYTEA